MAMSEKMQMQHHHEIELLLPWYVNGTLEPAERDRVAEHIDDCEKCHDSVRLLTDVQSAVLRNKATPMVPLPAVNKLLDSIDAKSSSRHRDWRRPQVMFAAALAASVLIIVVIFSFQDESPPAPKIFETATSVQSAAAMDYVLNIQFESGTSATAHQQVLNDIAAQDISAGVDELSYRVVVRVPAASLEELERYTSDLEAMPAIKAVEVVALQLPVSPRQ